MRCASCSRPLPEGAKFCPFCGHEVESTAIEERRLVTVLFADIVGYTALVEHLDPERVKRLIDDAFERLIGDIIEHGGKRRQAPRRRDPGSFWGAHRPRRRSRPCDPGRARDARIAQRVCW